METKFDWAKCEIEIQIVYVRFKLFKYSIGVERMNDIMWWYRFRHTLLESPLSFFGNQNILIVSNAIASLGSMFQIEYSIYVLLSTLSLSLPLSLPVSVE